MLLEVAGEYKVTQFVLWILTIDFELTKEERFTRDLNRSRAKCHIKIRIQSQIMIFLAFQHHANVVRNLSQMLALKIRKDLHFL